LLIFKGKAYKDAVSHFAERKGKGHENCPKMDREAARRSLKRQVVQLLP
jgi:hypothetical protein